MILDSYLERFGQALEKGNQKEAILQIHLMLQRDPLDQQNHILNALKQAQLQWPDLPCEFQWEKLPGEDALLEEQQTALGDALQSFDFCPTKETMQRIKTLAHRLINRGQLDLADYSIHKEMELYHVNTPLTTHHASSQHQKIKWFYAGLILTGLITGLILLYLFYPRS